MANIIAGNTSLISDIFFLLWLKMKKTKQLETMYNILEIQLSISYLNAWEMFINCVENQPIEEE